ncbi:MAG: biotin--[acetyl-CoA-carboxylase] ligase [Verrucomicrobia bacterium]|nr:biotin--[acetyl-CoA-carboxylase] ligase [Verrucomicrobiota bacterium]
MHEIHLDTIDSTNVYAKLHAAEFPAGQITCITAEEQTAGRGRYQRHWVSPRGVNLLVTFYFQLPLQTLHLTSIAQVMAVSFASLLIKEELSPKIKWPNDVQLNGKKVSGVLCETSFHRSHADIFLGIGINVNMEKETLQNIDQPATSLKAETGRTWDRKSLLHKLQEQFSSDLNLFKNEGFTPFHSPFENLLAYKGEKISCFDGRKEWTGICHSLTNDGQLNLYLADHSIQVIAAGDVKNLRGSDPCQ